MNLNQTKIIGHIANDFQVRETPSWIKVVDVTLFAKSSVKASDWSTKEIPSYTIVTFWGNLADIIEKYTSKWSQIFVSWRLETDSWDWEDWKKRYKTRVVAEDMDLLSRADSEWVPSWYNSITEWLNEAQLLWNITKDIELKETPSWYKVLSFSVATNRKWKNSRTWEMQENAQFHNVVLWNKLAEDFSALAKKWQKVFISWKVLTRSYDAPDWEKRYVTEINWENARVLWFAWEWFEASESNIVSSEKTSKSENVDMDIPEIDYSTDVKAEDLPF